jgi:NAD(P)-dependent dehydrogenase (short-subunit alcohol dehydrogenase family)
MGRRAPELEAALTILGPNATAVCGDVTVAADLQRLHDVVAATGKGLDIVFANAGIMEIAALGEISQAHFDLLFGTNVKGVVLTVEAPTSRSTVAVPRASPRSDQQ